MNNVVFAFLVLVVVVAWLVFRRANELCVFRIDKGECRLDSGKAPAPLFGQIDDIVKRARLDQATFRIVVESGLPRLIADPSVPDGVVQQVRNCVGQYQVAQFRKGRSAK
jgi:hypothetical protein